MLMVFVLKHGNRVQNKYSVVIWIYFHVACLMNPYKWS